MWTQIQRIEADTEILLTCRHLQFILLEVEYHLQVFLYLHPSSQALSCLRKQCWLKKIGSTAPFQGDIQFKESDELNETFSGKMPSSFCDMMETSWYERVSRPQASTCWLGCRGWAGSIYCWLIQKELSGEFRDEEEDVVTTIDCYRTRDRTFESVSHLIDYHRNNKLPIISAESALRLDTPVRKVRRW